jgi:hypothetical protein
MPSIKNMDLANLVAWCDGAMVRWCDAAMLECGNGCHDVIGDWRDGAMV